jgi:hypothetical protein
MQLDCIHYEYRRETGDFKGDPKFSVLNGNNWVHRRERGDVVFFLSLEGGPPAVYIMNAAQ